MFDLTKQIQLADTEAAKFCLLFSGAAQMSVRKVTYSPYSYTGDKQYFSNKTLEVFHTILQNVDVM